MPMMPRRRTPRTRRVNVEREGELNAMARIMKRTPTTKSKVKKQWLMAVDGKPGRVKTTP